MDRPEDCIMLIFGATGDLSKRKLIPSLFALFEQKLLPENFAILGTSIQDISDDEFRSTIGEALKPDVKSKETISGETTSFLKHLYYQSADATISDDYRLIRERLLQIDRSLNTGGKFIYYLSTSPSLFKSIIMNLGEKGLQKETKDSWRRIVVEKPFGRDLDTARDLNSHLKKIFNENQIYRIDHYLGKETVQNILAFRFSNGIVEPIWNRNYVECVEITAAEQLGVEKRGGYYDEYGALRDMVQNHLLQVLSMIAIEPPSFFNAEAVRNETVKVIESLRTIQPGEVENCVVRGQYVGSEIDGEKITAYRNEEGVDRDSRTETFVALKVFIDNWRWGGVPFYLRTGKRLPTKVSEVVVTFKKTPHHLFSQSKLGEVEANQMIIRIQPDEGILLKFGMKKPGAGYMIEEVSMDFYYSELSDVYLPSAYEHLLLDCMLGDPTNFKREDAVEASWRFVDPIVNTWKNNPEIKLYGYPAGTWGPEEAKKIFNDPVTEWHYPCSNIADQGEFCDL